MTILGRSPVGDFLLGLTGRIRCFSRRLGWAPNIAIMILLSVSANAEPAHCAIQVRGKMTLDQTCDLTVKNDVVKMVNPDGSSVSIAVGANNFLLATIHAIRDMAEPKLTKFKRSPGFAGVAVEV
ncbi:MAG TPA: hypothetical protein VN715_01815 [Roseiarcus sp.]|nr:hypothetical protein [Roseiarcus sp.]